MVDGKIMTDLKIIYEDNHLLICVKPFNVPVQEDSSHDLDLVRMAKNYLKIKYQKPGNVYVGLVHRLDRPVGGVMVLAKTSKAAARLSQKVQDHEWHKKYLAIVHGKINASGKLVDKISKDAQTFNAYIDPVKGKESILEYQCLAYNAAEDLSLVEINLITGRHHQIRLQLHEAGHPIYGDQRYGLKEKAQIALFAYHLAFHHPVKDTSVVAEVLPPLTGKWLLFAETLKKLEEKA